MGKSIVGEKGYRDASGSGWTVTDKIFGYLDKAVNIYNKGRSGEFDSGVSADVDTNPAEIGILGMPKPWGAIIVGASVLLVGIGIYKIAK